MSGVRDLRVRQLDEALAAFEGLRERPVPREGWVKAVRTALGMSLRQLAERAGLSKSAVVSIENNESRQTVQLDSLSTVANAMGCDLVYAIVPRAGTLARTLERQAERIAQERVRRVSDSMDLEAQGIVREERARQVREAAAEILRDRGQSFWDA